MNPYLQTFLYIDVFIIGVLVSLAYSHGRAHITAKKQPPKEHPGSDQYQLPNDMRVKLLEQSSEKFQHILNHSAEQLQSELKQTSDRINETIKKLAADIITKELEGFQAMFKQYQDRAAGELTEGRKAIDQYSADMRAKINEDIEQEKRQLLERLDNKISDAAVSFLSETLGHEIDLGSQEKYLIDQLEAHKDELKQAVKNEV